MKWKIECRGAGPDPRGATALATTEDLEIASDIVQALALNNRGKWYQASQEGSSETIGPLRCALLRWNG